MSYITSDVGRISMSGDEFTWMVDDLFTHLTNTRISTIFSEEFEFANGIWGFFLFKNRVICKRGCCMELYLMQVKTCKNFHFCSEMGIRGPSENVVHKCRKQSDFPYLVFKPKEYRHFPTFEFFVNFKKMCNNCNLDPSRDLISALIGIEQREEQEDDLGRHLQEPQAFKSKSVCKLHEDLEQLLFSEKDSDVTLNVEGREFKAHRLILGIRSPVFSAMFQHDMSERQSGVVDIEDCDPDTFNDFLLYVYTGTVELRSEKATNLYATADKYQMAELKAECLDYMKNNVSVENFCDFFTLSLQYCETELTNIATQFFVRKATDIALTAKWQLFMAANSVVANELFLKGLKAGTDFPQGNWGKRPGPQSKKVQFCDALEAAPLAPRGYEQIFSNRRRYF